MNIVRQAFAAAVLLAFPLVGAPARAAQPITIGFSMELTGPLSVVGRTGLLAMQIWVDDINKKGGLLGRPVKLDYYDDQSNPSLVPGIYTKLIDIDKVDLLISSYGTNLTVPAMPIVIQHNRLFFGLFALAINNRFHYPRYFSMLVYGPHPQLAFSKGFFDLAMAQKPKPKTVALVAADAEFAQSAVAGARTNAKAAGLKIVYDRSYPPGTVDFTPIVRAVGATRPDIVYVASYPPGTVGILRAVHEIGLQTNMLGGAFVGTAAAALETQLGPEMNGIINGALWAPVPTMMFPGIAHFLKEYQARAKAAGVDPLGYFMPPFAYAELQILGDAVEATRSLNQDTLARYIHSHTFHTIVGDITFGPSGEWIKARPVWIQYHNIKGHGLDQFEGAKTVMILAPPKYKTGTLIYPYTRAH